MSAEPSSLAGGRRKVKMLQDEYFRRSSKCGNYSKFLKEQVDNRLEAFPIEFKDAWRVSCDDLVADEFKTPFKFRSSDPVPTGLKLPPKPTSQPDNMYAYLRSIAKSIGEDHPIKLIEVYSQRQLDGYEFGDYVDYLEKRDSNHKTVNLISLELSKSTLSCNIMGPEFVRKLDWIDQVWPINKRLLGDYPCVQRYCLTGMAGSYTDFHIDFGGTSVWYHVVYGGKRFYVIEPTLANLKRFEEWKPSSNTFFGDTVTTKCYYVDIRPGETFMIPPGWIHAVYTPQDSVVFGGNFLHSFGIVPQLQINEIEQRTSIAAMYRFPSFKLLNWMLLCNIYDPVLRAVNSDGSFNEEKVNYFPVHKFLKPNIFQDVTMLVKVCENWLRLLEVSEYTQFEDTSRQLCRMSPKVFLAEWWLLLQRAARTCKTEDVKTLNFIYSELKQRKNVDVLDASFFPDERYKDTALSQTSIEGRGSLRVNADMNNPKLKLKVAQQTKEDHPDNTNSNIQNEKEEEDDDESYDENDDAQDDEDATFFDEAELISSKKRGRVINDSDDDNDKSEHAVKACKDEKTSSNSNNTFAKNEKKKLMPLQKLLLKKSTKR